MTAEPLDPQQVAMLRRVGGDALIRRVFGLFLEVATQRLDTVRTAHAAGDLGSVEHEAHALASSCGNVGAMRLFRLAKAVEAEAAERRAEQLAGMIDELSRGFDEVRPQVLAIMQGADGAAPGGPNQGN